MNTWVALLGTGAISSIAGAAISALFGRRKIAAEVRATDASTAEIIANTAVILVAPLEKQIRELTERVAVLETENAKLRAHIKELESK